MNTKDDPMTKANPTPTTPPTLTPEELALSTFSDIWIYCNNCEINQPLLCGTLEAIPHLPPNCTLDLCCRECRAVITTLSRGDGTGNQSVYTVG